VPARSACWKTRVLRELHHQRAAFLHTDVLGGNRRLVDPLLELCGGPVVAALDFTINVGTSCRGAGLAAGPEHGPGTQHATDESPASQFVHVDS
jgi:hypothetical protein